MGGTGKFSNVSLELALLRLPPRVAILEKMGYCRSEMLGVSVAIVVHNEEENLPRVLHSLAPASPRAFLWEILVIDNCSLDGTREAFRAFANRFPEWKLRWISLPVNHLGQARQLALEEARYPLIAFIDADCTAPPFWMERFQEKWTALERKEPALLGIGGGNLPPDLSHPFYASMRLVLSTWLGSMGSLQAKPLDHESEVHHLPTCNVFYHRERALRAGGFHPAFASVCEDLEFSRRAEKAGFRFLFQPGLEVAHFHVPSWRAWAKKMFRYGQGQMEVARLYPHHLAGVKALPLVATGALLALFFFFPFTTCLLLLAWGAALGVYCARLGYQNGRMGLAPHILVGFATTHAFYSAGEWYGGVAVLWNRLRGSRR